MTRLNLNQLAKDSIMKLGVQTRTSLPHRGTSHTVKQGSLKWCLQGYWGVLKLDVGGIQQCWEVKSESGLMSSFSKNLNLLQSRLTSTWYPLTFLVHLFQK